MAIIVNFVRPLRVLYVRARYMPMVHTVFAKAVPHQQQRTVPGPVEARKERTAQGPVGVRLKFWRVAAIKVSIPMAAVAYSPETAMEPVAGTQQLSAGCAGAGTMH